MHQYFVHNIDLEYPENVCLKITIWKMKLLKASGSVTQHLKSSKTDNTLYTLQ